MKWSDSLAIQLKSLSKVLIDSEVSGQIDSVIEMLKKARGIIYFTGIGKNMYTAARVSDTFQSLGFRSMFVDAVNIFHGGMGIFSKDDVLVAISKSGETEELLRLITLLKKRDFENILAITSNNESSLRKLARTAVVIPIENEGDHLGLAPIASTLIYGAVLDSIAVQISSERVFSREDFVFNHPGGALGRSKV